jgi:1,4-dihydroxy-2-naphthoyl-CoA hydrolase
MPLMSIADIEARLRGLFPDLMGMRLTEALPDRVVATLLVRPDLCTTGGILHGGAIMAFADTLGAVATVVNMPEGSGTATIESKTNFFRPAPVGGVVTGTSTPLHRGRRTQTWETRITDGENRLVASVTQTQMVF